MFFATRAVQQSTSLERCSRFAARLILLGVIAGCGGGTGGDSGSQGLIGPAGGTVTSADGKVSLVIPPNAVGVTTQFTIEPDNSGAPSTRIVGAVYNINSVPSGTAFPLNALPQLTMPYPSGLANPATLTIGTTDNGRGNGQWIDVAGSQVNQASQTVTAPLAHLSPYAVLQPAADNNNQPPIASVGGPYQGQVGQLVSFNAAGTIDPDDDPLTYTWNFGDNSQTSTGALQTATHTYASAGSFTVTLTVTDGRGGSDVKSTTATIIDVTPTNHPPSAVITGDSAGTVGQPLTFSGTSSSDPDNDPLTYAWNFGDNSQTATSSSPSPSHTYASAGTFTVRLTVTDPADASGEATRDVTITTAPPVNQTPIAIVNGPYAGTVGQVLTFSDGGSYDPDGSALTYSWDFGDGSPLGSGSSVTHFYTTANTFDVTLTVTDPAGASASASTTATITPHVNQPPTALMTGPSAGVVGQVLAFSDAGSSDPEGGVLTYAWFFGDTGTASGPSTTHSYATAGTFTVTLTVTDPDGASGSDSKTVTISPPGSTNNPPTITSLTVPPTGLVLQNMVLKGSGSDIDRDTLTYTWEFGDGSPNVSTATAGVVHEYQTAGYYTVTFTVDDGKGGSASTTRTIAITLPSAPVAFAHSRTIPMRQSQALYLNQHAIELDGSGVPPLRYTIVSVPTHFPYDLTTGFDMTAGDNYQWWDPVVNKMRLECRRQTGIPAYCYATESSHAENTTTGLVADPINRTLFRSTVLYTPERCWYWTGPWVDTFSFTVTDATGATSAPATVTINVNPNTICVAPSF